MDDGPSISLHLTPLTPLVSTLTTCQEATPRICMLWTVDNV